MAQNIMVALLVGGCFVYALWTLGPKALRSRLAAALLTWPLPRLLQKPLQSAVQQQGGCGSCGGCERSGGTPAKPGAPLASTPSAQSQKPLTFVRGNYARKTPL
jgi:hypothetical protein